MNTRVTSGDKASEEWVRRVGLAQEFGVELAGDKEWMVFEFDHFNEFAIRARAAEKEAGFFEMGAVFVVEFVAMTMAFVDDEGAVELRGF